MVVATARHPLAISKMHGAGNDFVVLDLREAQDPHPAMCSAIADRHKGVGCDLILGVAPPRSRSAVASYRIWTPDGSPSRQCGNGARCVAAWVVREGLAQGPEFALDSPSGTHAINVLPNGLFRIAMGVPRFAPEHIPLAHFAREQDVYEVDIEAGGRLRFAAVSIGNPHAVVDVTDIESARVSQLGPALQNSGYFPESVNVGFAQVIARDRIALRVYEFGSGETLACGTGACAAAAVMMRRGRVERDVAVALPGGDLHIAWPSPDAPVTLTGPAAFVFEGRLSFDVPR